jgi:protein NrfC
MAESKEAGVKEKKVLRREFLAGGGAALAAGALEICVGNSSALAGSAAKAAPKSASKAPSYPESTGYIVYDSRLCFGCQSCMFACSMTHEGEANPSLSRIQIIKDAPSFTKYPYDILMSVCRQCVTPVCVQKCPSGACHVDAAYGNIRMINQSKCIGCKTCINSCPQRPHRTIWDPVKKKATKCDLCAKAPFWSQEGGPNGKQACIQTCPAKALKLVKDTPLQIDVAGYDVNLAPASGGGGMFGAPKTAPATPAKTE